MKSLVKTLATALGLGFFIAISGCAPEMGSDKWCASLKEKPKGDWTANELSGFAKHCILK
ncbi:DUF3012 domain-containing protein [Sulfuriflexus sp.]|uniref:DUF3012 domain-containing protein n=1 Tax=Sulfuriflexus sp. TaxID=2015443 RepID=UPI0028CE7503|nr:DUF3012 domain-containing protein [Sulfuriflexus sp.]MDT8403477.1 DUF3012 domain-containing protein [Sulfuriflexus sp.]